MKRAILLLLIVLALFAAVSGTIAYYTDNVRGAGVVESANLAVLQHEYERVKDQNGAYTASLRRFTQGQMMYPGVLNPTLTREDVKVGDYTVQMHDETLANFVDKIVTAENNGSAYSYVRTFVAVPARSQGDTPVDWLHLDFNLQHGWVLSPDVIRGQLIDGHYYDIYWITNENQLAPGATTAPSLLGFYLDPRVTTRDGRYQYVNGSVRVDLGTAEDLTILVTTQASQAIVFEADGAKTAAQVALDTTFGSPADGIHPWTDVKSAYDQASLDALLASATYDTVIALHDGAYTLPAQLPHGIRLMGMGLNVTLSAPTLSAYDVELDNVTFTSPVVFTGHGTFEEVTFLQGWHISPTSGDVLVSDCRFDAYQIGDGDYIVHIADCLSLQP